MSYSRTSPGQVAAQLGVGVALGIVLWKSVSSSPSASQPQDAAAAIGDQQATDLDRSLARELAQTSGKQWAAQRAASEQGRKPGSGA